MMAWKVHVQNAAMRNWDGQQEHWVTFTSGACFELGQHLMS